MESRVPSFGPLAPEHVLRGLRSLDDRAELVWIEKDRWLLGRYFPENTQGLRDSGGKMKESTLRAIEQRGGKLTHTDVVRLRMAELKLACFQFTSEYHIPLPDSAVVHDQRVMDWMYKNLPTWAIDDAFETDEDVARERRYAQEDLADTERARAAYKYLFTLSHYLGKQSLDTGPRSGWKRHKLN